MPAIRSQFLALALLALAVYGVERLIVTDREAIANLGGEIARALGERRYDRLEAALEEGFRFRGLDRAATVAHVRGLVEKHRPIAIGVVLVEIEVRNDTAVARGQVSAQVYGRPIRHPIEVDLVRGPDGWLLLKVRSPTAPAP